MVKVAAPALSLSASGTIGNAMTFSTWKGRPYVRERVVPANPKSGLQTGYRAMFKFLAENWAALSAAEKATYEALAAAFVISPFNAYVRFNQQRWRRYTTPSQETPATETGTVGAWNGSPPAATGGVASITLDYTLTTLNDNWGMLIYKDTSAAFTTMLSKVIAAVLLADTAAHAYIDSPLVAGTYYYNFRTFTDDGVMSADVGEVNAAAT